MKRLTRIAVAVTALAAGFTVVAPAPADAAERGLCWIGVCGFAYNSGRSDRSIHFQCADGNWRWLHPGQKSTSRCKDVNKIHTSPTARTWRLGKSEFGQSVWMRLRKGTTYAVHDGQTWNLKVHR